MLSRFLVVVCACALAACGDESAADDGCSALACEGDASFVVQADWLLSRLGDAGVQVVDTRARGAYEQSRIPGAVHLRPEQLATTRDGVRSQVAPAEEAEPVLQMAGLERDALLVVYGEPPEYDPARIVWALRHYGHEDVRYLDGGVGAWTAAGGELSTDASEVQPTDYTIDAVDVDLRVTSDYVLSRLGDAPYDTVGIELVDARSPGEFDAGRIPTAQLIQWTDNLEAGFLRPLEELRVLHGEVDPSVTTITYCLTGWRGSFAWLTLKYLGYEDVRLYDGSWAEWGDGAFPVEP